MDNNNLESTKNDSFNLENAVQENVPSGLNLLSRTKVENYLRKFRFNLYKFIDEQEWRPKYVIFVFQIQFQHFHMYEQKEALEEFNMEIGEGQYLLQLQPSYIKIFNEVITGIDLYTVYGALPVNLPEEVDNTTLLEFKYIFKLNL